MRKKKSKKELSQEQHLNRSELARLSGVRESTIKYYTEQGLLPFLNRGERLVRLYERGVALERLKEIRAFKRKGYTIFQLAQKFKSD